MSDKQREVDFYRCRVRETALRLIKSIVNNHRLSEQDRIKLLCQISNEHTMISSLVMAPLDRVFEKKPKDPGDK